MSQNRSPRLCKAMRNYHSLSEVDSKEFGKYLHYRDTDRNRSFIRLHAAIQADKGTRELDAYLSEVFTERKLTPGNRRRINNTFLEYLLDFMRLRVMESNPRLRDLLLLQAFNERGNQKDFPYYYRKAQSNFEAEKNVD